LIFIPPNGIYVYTQQGDYLLPDLKLPEQPKVKIGILGKRHAISHPYILGYGTPQY
jgi:hypothetical protein